MRPRSILRLWAKRVNFIGMRLQKEVSRYNLSVKKIQEKFLGMVDVHEAALRGAIDSVEAAGGELRPRNSEAKSSSWLDSGLDEMIEEQRKRDEPEEDDEPVEVGPWWKIPVGYKPERIGET